MTSITLKLHIEENLGVMKYQGKSYQVTLVMVQDLATLSMGMKIWRTQHFDIYWKQRADLRKTSQMICLKKTKMSRLREVTCRVPVGRSWN